MTTSTRRAGGRVQPIRGPFELVQAIPHLIGYHPAESLVLVGLRRGNLVVTARLDLADIESADCGGAGGAGDETDRAAPGGLLHHSVARAVDGGASEFVAVVYTEASDSHRAPDDDVRILPPARGGRDRSSAGLVSRPGVEVISAAAAALAHSDGLLLDALLVREGRCWSYLGSGPTGGWDLGSAPSPFVAEATVEGSAPRCDRAAVAASLDPYPDDVRAELEDALAEVRKEGTAAVANGAQARHDRTSRRAVLAAVRACHEPGWVAPGNAEMARLAVALTDLEIRDDVWLLIEAGTSDGRPLMLELARRCPSPYDVAPLFLYGWACWRAGNSMLAGEAAQRAVAVDPGYTAAQTLVDTVGHGVDPHRVPPLRRPRRLR